MRLGGTQDFGDFGAPLVGLAATSGLAGLVRRANFSHVERHVTTFNRDFQDQLTRR